VRKFGLALGEPVSRPHVSHTWPLGWAVGSIVAYALRASPTVQPAAKGNSHDFATCGATVGSAKPPPKQTASPLKHGQAGVKSRDGTIRSGWRDSDRETASNGFVSKPVLIKKMDKETRGTFSDDRP